MLSEDVEDRSNTPKGCNAMYVKDVENGKRTYRHIFIIPFLIWYCLNVMLSMSKMLKIDQIHLMAVMLYMSKMSKMSKIDQTNTPKGCMYVGDVKDGKRTYSHILVHNFLNI